MDRASQQAWMMQWRRAAVALEEQRRRELRALTEHDALAASDALLSLAATLPLDTNRLTDSGLVRQQALFHRLAGEPDLWRRAGGPGLLPRRAGSSVSSERWPCSDGENPA